jgi:hypothetical protein
MIYFCCENERRRNAVREHPALNGIDFLEVSDDLDDPFEERQRTLFVHFIKDLAPDSLTAANVRIEGGERIRNIAVTKVTIGAVASPPSSPPVTQLNLLTVEVSGPGDFSIYTLRLVPDAEAASPVASFDFDPLLSAVDFSFKVACPSDFDCQTERRCPPEPERQPEIDYLAKDYASFRQLMLDRMALLTPQWRERNPADIGIALVELLAYVGDHFSYQQDAVATESYLGTARRRASVRRHARLVDYLMHDGSNARVWVQVEVTSSGDGLPLTQGTGRETTKLLTGIGLPPNVPVIPQQSAAFKEAMLEQPQVFELMPPGDFKLFEAHNEMKFYTWGARACCLPKDATNATLDGDFSNLKKGDVLVLMEKRGPQTGGLEDSDPAHRHAVRLTEVSVTSDPLGGKFKDPPDDSAVPVTEIKWHSGDALPFALCVSSIVGTEYQDDVGVALGNIVLADHGMTLTDEPEKQPFDLDQVTTSLVPETVPASNSALTRVTPSTADRCEAQDIKQTPARYRPRLKHGPITQAAPYDPGNLDLSASSALNLSIENSEQLPVPSITLKDAQKPGAVWEPERDLLASGATDPKFVVEVETDGTAYLRFGNDRTGMRPAEGVKFLATYRIGNGAAGNVGAEAIKYIVSSDANFTSDPSNPKIKRVWNPLPARGGIEAETIEHVRQNAPAAFRRQERAVTPKDYEEIITRPDVAQRCGLDVQRAAATLRWTGSWHTMFLTADRLGGQAEDEDFESNLRRCLERFRMAGQDLEVNSPHFVSLEIEMLVCVKPNYFFGDVKKALLEVFSNRTLPDGRRGVFHPDNFTFGQPVFLSSIYAAAQAVTGVDSVTITKFQRQGIASNRALNSGRLDIGRLEIARLDNDPNFRERGVFTPQRG